MAARQKDGAPLLDHLRSIPEAARNDEVRELLRERPAPTRMLYLWDAFCQLARSRRAGFSGPEPLGLDQVYYWQLVFGNRLHAWEIDVIYRIDALWMDSVQEGKRGD